MNKLSITASNDEKYKNKYHANCEACFGLCCVALPYAKSADFAFNKNGGQPCKNLQNDFRCQIHKDLRSKGFKGCTVYECFGAGQKVSRIIYSGKDWREDSKRAEEMFQVFPIVQQLHEMLYYLQEALHREEAKPIYEELQLMLEETEALTLQPPETILNLHVPSHRSRVSQLLHKVSELVKSSLNGESSHNDSNKIKHKDLIGANLRGASLAGADLRGALLISANLRGADLRQADWIGADMRDANLHGADLRGSLFLTQAQLNAANGDTHSRLPNHLHRPSHWL